MPRGRRGLRSIALRRRREGKGGKLSGYHNVMSDQSNGLARCLWWPLSQPASSLYVVNLLRELVESSALYRLLSILDCPGTCDVSNIAILRCRLLDLGNTLV